MSKKTRTIIKDGLSLGAPSSIFDRFGCKLHTSWLRRTYPFASFGSGGWVHQSCDVRRNIAPYISIGSSVAIDRDVWLNIPFIPDRREAVITLEDGCGIGRRCMISAQNHVHVGRNTVFGPHVLVMDHNHEFEDVNLAIALQGTTDGGEIVIEEGCWIGFGATIVCGTGRLVIGRNTVIGANSVVTRSVPRYSVITGNPARVVKQFDVTKQAWVLGSSGSTNRPIRTEENKADNQPELEVKLNEEYVGRRTANQE
jgi:acetyltransferase-like isoleucine patch superfamily enzyme